MTGRPDHPQGCSAKPSASGHWLKLKIRRVILIIKNKGTEEHENLSESLIHTFYVRMLNEAFFAHMLI